MKFELFSENRQIDDAGGDDKLNIEDSVIAISLKPILEMKAFISNILTFFPFLINEGEILHCFKIIPMQ